MMIGGAPADGVVATRRHDTPRLDWTEDMMREKLRPMPEVMICRRLRGGTSDDLRRVMADAGVGQKTLDDWLRGQPVRETDRAAILRAARALDALTTTEPR